MKEEKKKITGKNFSQNQELDQEREKENRMAMKETAEIEEIIRIVEQSSQDIPIPESLNPDRMKNKLLQKRRKKLRRFTEAAAAIVFLIALGGVGIYQMDGKESGSTESQKREEHVLVDITENESLIGDFTKSQTVGTYHLAENYEEIYKAIDAYYMEMKKYNVVEDLTDCIMEESREEVRDETTSDSMATNASEGEASTDFSTTNTQVDGIDESDFVKNDGEYLYVQDEEKVTVIDIREDKMKTISTIRPELEENDHICDMYVDDKRVILIIERTLNYEHFSSFENSYSTTDCIAPSGDAKVIMQTYDVTDPMKVTLVGTMTVDGAYKESRKEDKVIFLFTLKNVGMMEEVDKKDLIPCINGKQIAPDCIYMQSCIASEIIVASASIDAPDTPMDQLVLMGSNAQVYMGKNAIYLYKENYDEKCGTKTEITRFSLTGGYFNGGYTASVAGSITDTFAISESEGVVRVLTTRWNEEEGNELHLFDYAMDELGSLTGIAPGEEIYAARYIGDIAYFITYHNTDPLFAVDISDTQKPKMLGEVKMTGYSDYLHPYGENLLLGIGYETDPETSEQLGVKLTMFDISNPVDLKIIDSVVIEDCYTTATYDYKAILADPSKNLIGFEVSQWSSRIDGTIGNYLVYRWKEDHFVKVMTQKRTETSGYGTYLIRGCYSRMRFYCIYKEENTYIVKSYDMEQNFKILDTISM